MTRRFVFLVSGGRPNGNTERLAYRAADALPDAVRQDWIDLTTPALPPFRDLRGEEVPPPDGRLGEIARSLRPATDIVFVAPVYWYALPAPAKLLLDHWSNWLEVPGFDFADWIRGKNLWLITVRADADPGVVAPLEAAMERTAGFLGMTWRGVLNGLGDQPGDVLEDADTLARAPRFFTA
ncbi:flavodoxin family protein [Aliigemmobacter aestuarii]|nr:NAD(P)H-dependent oxidoreductase [Gemmobacter aestuarii]